MSDVFAVSDFLTKVLIVGLAVWAHWRVDGLERIVKSLEQRERQRDAAGKD